MQSDWRDRPPPPGARPVKAHPLWDYPWAWISAAVILVALMIAAVYVPIPSYYKYLPGPVKDIGKLVTVDQGETYSSEGKLYLTTVSVDTHVTALDILIASFNDEIAVVSEEQVTGGQTFKELTEQQEAEM